MVWEALNSMISKRNLQLKERRNTYTIPCRAICFASVFWKERLNSSNFFKSTKAKQLARQGIEFNSSPQTEATTFTFASVPILLLWSSLTLVAEKKTMFVMISGNA